MFRIPITGPYGLGRTPREIFWVNVGVIIGMLIVLGLCFVFGC